MANRVDLTQPLPEVDYEDEWLDEDGAWDDGLAADKEPEPEPRRGRRDRRDRGRSAEDARQAERVQTAPKGQTSALTDLILLLFKVALVAGFLVVLFTFFYGITQARDTSMEPAVKEGDIVIYYRPDKDYSAGDAIVVEYNGELQVRRVVAIAGDTVDISSDGGLIINGSTQIEADIYTETYPYTEGITFPVTVGEGEVFVLGDDRTDATDSRIYGTVSIGATKGGVMTVIRRRGI